MSQHDPAFADLEYMQSYGCNFMATIAYPQMLAGEAFNGDQIKSIWSEAGGNSSILNITADKDFGEGSVANPDRLANIAFSKLQLVDLGLIFGTPQNPENLPANATHIANKYQIKLGNGAHFMSGDLWGNVLYNSGNSTDWNFTRTDNIWAYQRTTK